MTAQVLPTPTNTSIYNTKLFKVVQSFDKYEINRLRKFIRSPYFNQDETLVQLFNLMVELTNEGQTLSKVEIWSAIQGNNLYDDVRFRKYCSDLLKLIERFLAQEVFEQKKLRKSAFLIEAVGKKELSELYGSTIKRVKHLTHKQSLKTAEFYSDLFEIEKKYYEYILSSETAADIKRKTEKNLEEMMSNLDSFYIAEKLKYYCEILYRKAEFSQDYQVKFIPEIIKQISNTQNELLSPPEAIYFQIYQTLIDSENEDHFNGLKVLLAKYIHYFPTSEAAALYSLALNYCTIKINKGEQKYLQEYFELNNILLEKELIFSDGLLNPWQFKNIVLIALRLGKFEWTENFIYNYKERLPPSLKENAVTFNLALLFFYQKKYGKVIEQLQSVEYEDPVYNLNSKSILIGSYYETDEIEPLYSLFESFRAYLNRHNDIPEQRKKLFLNLIKFTKRLTRIIAGDQKSLDKLKNDIDNSEGVASLKWLKEKIAELES